ncbi:MAG TPA: hypothetical protein DDZ90_17045 [Planctomycetaceae bacterium]|nr:hypothetical protein [Gimesia sp.]HBL45092.1 hypothetical protein [Planctomycetaceae bacterium]
MFQKQTLSALSPPVACGNPELHSGSPTGVSAELKSSNQLRVFRGFFNPGILRKGHWDLIHYFQ